MSMLSIMYKCRAQIDSLEQSYGKMKVKLPAVTGPVFTKKLKMRIRLGIKLMNSHNMLKISLNVLKFALPYLGVQECHIDVTKTWLSYKKIEILRLILILDLILIFDQDQI